MEFVGVCVPGADEKVMIEVFIEEFCRMGMGEDETIEHHWISKAIENAQKKVEAHNFDIRKTVLEYDDVMNQQRTTVYARRKQILSGGDTKDQLTDMVDVIVDGLSQEFDPKNTEGEFNQTGWDERCVNTFGYKPALEVGKNWSAETLGRTLFDQAIEFYDKKEAHYGAELMRQVERFFMLQTLDTLWKDHLLAMDHLREGIGLRGYGQKDPRMEYKKEGFAMFEAMMMSFYEDAVQKLFKVQIQKNDEVPLKRTSLQPMQLQKALVAPAVGAGIKAQGPAKPETYKLDMLKVGRNDPCPCGSGKKYKKCHGA
jgi:preprotein translocase subunit SecA